jgi:predicted metal-dependent peptidase
MKTSYFKRINDARVELSSEHPFLGYIAQQTEIHLKEGIQTASTNGKDIHFDPKFLDQITDEELLFVFYHELLHIVLFHPLRKLHRTHKRFNIACDIVINDYLKSIGISHGELKGVFGSHYNMRGTRMSAEQVYEKLPEDASIIGFDFHDLWDELTDKGLEEYLQELFKKAYNEGYMPDERLARKIASKHGEYALFKKSPIISKHIERYIKKHIEDYQFDRIDKRYEDVLMPDFVKSIDALMDIWLVIDVSGSMQTHDYEKILTDLNALMKKYTYVSVHVSFFSNIVTKPVLVKNFKTLEKNFINAQTTLGTSATIIFESYYELFKKHERPALIIIYTDGYVREPKKEIIPKIPIIWFITENHNQKLPGKVILVNE